MKTALKKRIKTKQSGQCALSGAILPEKTALFDTDRITPKSHNGTYTDANTRLLLPRVHMLRHGTLRAREESLDEIKSIFDDRVQMMKLTNKIANQLRAYERRTDTPHAETEAFLKEQLEAVKARLSTVDKQLSKLIKDHPDELTKRALAVPGIGPITVAALTVYIELEKASTASSLWKYCGLHTSSRERYTKGQAGGGNKTLRTVLYTTAESLMKSRSNAYRVIYDRVKDRLAASEKITTSNNTQGKAVQVAWKDAKPSHRHGAALRAIMKRVLVHYWLVGRTTKRLPIRLPYAQEMLGHTHIDKPEDFGW